MKLPIYKKALKTMWVFKYKTKLVVKGFGQKKSDDYEEIFSPFLNMSSIRVILSLAACMNSED